MDRSAEKQPRGARGRFGKKLAIKPKPPSKYQGNRNEVTGQFMPKCLTQGTIYIPTSKGLIDRLCENVRTEHIKRTVEQDVSTRDFKKAAYYISVGLRPNLVPERVRANFEHAINTPYLVRGNEKMLLRLKLPMLPILEPSQTPPRQRSPSPVKFGVLKVNHVVATFNVGKTLDVAVISRSLINVEQKAFNKFNVHIRKQATTVSFFSSGKAICVGAKSMEDSKAGCRKAARMVQRVAGSGFKRYRVIIIMCTARLPCGINLEMLARNNTDHVFYTQGQVCNSAQVNIPDFNTVIRAHSTGSLILFGKNLVDMELAYSFTEEMAQEIWKFKTDGIPEEPCISLDPFYF